MKVGDLVWVRFPGGVGHAPSGRRPAIVRQSASSIRKTPTLLLIPLATQVNATRFPGTVLVETDAINNLRQRAVALVFQLTAVDKSFLDGVMGRVSPAVLQSLHDALDALTECPA